MKLIHLSDLHIGKRLLEHSFLEDQKDLFQTILLKIKEIQPDGIILAGDIYDKSLPSAEAVELFDFFLSELAKLHLPVFLISGNHDSAERIAFASNIMKESGIYISPVYHGEVKPIRLKDAYGPVNFYLLPFLRPSQVRRYYPDEKIETYTDAFRILISQMKLNKAERNILIAHQFVAGSETSGSEEMSVGGVESVDADVFCDFDYVALGHIHKRQTLKGNIHYSGTPMKYSFSELKNTNGFTVVQLEDKGNLSLSYVDLSVKKELKEVRGSFEEFMQENNRKQDYYHVILTDEEDIVDGAKKLRNVYPNLLKLDYDNTRTRTRNSILAIEKMEEKSVEELFDDFYELQNGMPMNEMQKEYFRKVVSELKGEDPDETA